MLLHPGFAEAVRLRCAIELFGMALTSLELFVQGGAASVLSHGGGSTPLRVAGLDADGVEVLTNGLVTCCN
jgi:hypothetical protein